MSYFLIAYVIFGKNKKAKKIKMLVIGKKKSVLDPLLGSQSVLIDFLIMHS